MDLGSHASIATWQRFPKQKLWRRVLHQEHTAWSALCAVNLLDFSLQSQLVEGRLQGRSRARGTLTDLGRPRYLHSVPLSVQEFASFWIKEPKTGAPTSSHHTHPFSLSHPPAHTPHFSVTPTPTSLSHPPPFTPSHSTGSSPPTSR